MSTETSSTTFFDHSKKIATKFLQTTVIVDDQAYFSGSPENQQVLSNLTTPGRPTGKQNVIDQAPAQISQDGKDDIQDDSHKLNAQAVINSFAKASIVCSVVKPTQDLDLPDMMAKLISSTDVMVLDWDLNRDNGEKALNILKRITYSAYKVEPKQLMNFRFRLQIIWMGHRFQANQTETGCWRALSQTPLLSGKSL